MTRVTRNSGGAHSKNRGNPSSHDVIDLGQPNTSPKFPCGTCNINIGIEDSVECELCKTWTHGGTKCSGLPPNIFEVIVDCHDIGVTYICTTCRINKTNNNHTDNNNNKSNDLTQLCETVKGLANALQVLSNKVDAQQSTLAAWPSLPKNSPTPNPTNHKQPVPLLAPPPVFHTQLPEIKQILHNEAVEIREREKRANSIIIRGLGADPNLIQQNFKDVVEQLLPGKHILLVEISPINANLVRAKIPDTNARRELLNNTKKLARPDSNFQQVFIKRDLTYRQRQELLNRRPSTQHPPSNQPILTSNPSIIPGSSPTLPKTPSQPSPTLPVPNSSHSSSQPLPQQTMAQMTAMPTLNATSPELEGAVALTNATPSQFPTKNTSQSPTLKTILPTSNHIMDDAQSVIPPTSMSSFVPQTMDRNTSTVPATTDLLTGEPNSPLSLPNQQTSSSPKPSTSSNIEPSTSKN